MTKHTPGPWTSDYGTRSSWVHLGDADDGRVVEVKGDNHQNDADFIAEAPAMLDALRNTEQYIYSCTKWCDDPLLKQAVENDLETVRAILARIGGGE